MREIKLNLRPLIKQLEVAMRRGETQEFLPSAYRSTFKGRGPEFEGFRQYLSGMDDARDIDWKSSLRSRDLLVRILREERNLSVFILFHVGDSMLYASTPKLKCEFGAELVATLAYGMLNVGDRVGLCMFTDKVVKLVPPGSGMRHFYFITRVLSDPKNYGGKFDLDHVLKFCVGYLRKGSLLFVVSDFLGLGKDWQRLFSMSALKFDLTAFVVRDPRDMVLPAENAQLLVVDPYSDRQLLIDTAGIHEEYENAATEQLIELTDTFVKTNSDYIVLFTDKEFLFPVLKFFERRRSRLK